MATSWSAAYDQDDPSGASKVVAGRIADTAQLDATFRFSALPYATTPMTEWLLDQVGYTIPPLPHTVYPPTEGREYPPPVRLA